LDFHGLDELVSSIVRTWVLLWKCRDAVKRFILILVVFFIVFYLCGDMYCWSFQEGCISSSVAGDGGQLGDLEES
jgi:hypothetical protein